MNRITSPALAIILAFTALSVAQADSLNCGGNIISQGDSQADLLEACGEPASRDGSRWVYEQEGSLPRIVTLANGMIQFIEAGEMEGFEETSPLGDRP
jgi:hypothetical protein